MAVISISVICFLTVSGAFAFPKTNQKTSPRDDLLVSTEQGQLLCEQTTVPNPLIACKGIPYAQPPLNSLRFRAPVPASSWSGVRDAKKFGNECIQPAGLPGTPAKGDEDCLYLNVYTPSTIGSRAVMVFIHGGGFTGGSGDDINYGPDLLVEEDVVLVTINYRLGVLGFLSTGDNNAQGNYGLKDAIEALRWVQRYISSFGGDPTRVTIFGESAGGSLVHYLVLSPITNGLFSRAISQSGTALNPWAFQPNPREEAFEAGRKLGINASTSIELMTALRLYSNPIKFGELVTISLDGRLPFQFAPSIENVDSQDPRAVAEHPLAAIQRGTFNPVPYIIGANSEEALYSILEVAYNPSIIEKINEDPSLLIPPLWDLEPESTKGIIVTSELKFLYFNGGPITDPLDYSRYCTDSRFLYYIYKTVRVHAARSGAQIYFYNFGYDGLNNYAKQFFNLTNLPGAIHSDELGYLFTWDGMRPRLGTPEDTVRTRMTKMWTNFAKTGDPTPTVEGVITTRWPRVSGNQEFLNITTNLAASTRPFEVRMETWTNLENLVGVNP